MNKEKFLKAILSAPQRMLCRIVPEDIIRDSEWLYKLNRSYNAINKCFPYYSFKYYLYNVVDTVSTLAMDQNNKQCIQHMLKAIIDDEAEEDDVSMLACIIALSCGVINDGISRSVLSFCHRTHEPDYRYWLTMDISKACFSYQRGFFREFYQIRKQLLKRIAEEGEYIELNNHNQELNTDICIVAYELTPTMADSLQRVVMMFTKAFKNNYTIHIVVLDSFYTPRKDRSKYGTLSGYRNHLTYKDKDKLQGMFGDEIELHLPKNMGYKDRYAYALSEIDAVKPRFIIDISDEFSPISYIYSQTYPTFYMPMRTGASSSFFTGILCPRWIALGLNEKWPYFEDEKVIIDWGLPEFVPNSSTPYERSELGFNDSDFIILTIAKVKNECDNSFIDGIARLLKTHKNMRWLIVGDEAPEYLKKNYPELLLDNVVIERAYENKLAELCSICNVLLRTDNSGGSGGTAIAAMNGLPIVMTNFECDPMRWLGRDYSDIDSYDDLFEEISRLESNREYYTEKSNQCRKLIEKAKDSPDKWNDLINKIEMKIENIENE